ncbi:hypothetical protein [Pseudactinotalea sp.]|uniref:hypothetical protein n=1 Tax=Pseudactinotalea sp. TaxID=1926260 RepID=UPI003B3A32D6
MSERQIPNGSGGGVHWVVHALLGVALGGAYVLVSGILGIQAEAARGGTSVTLGNRITDITEPGTPVPQLAAAAILGVGVWLLVTTRLRRAARIATVLGFALASLALIAWAVAAAPRSGAVGVGGDRCSERLPEQPDVPGAQFQLR